MLNKFITYEFHNFYGSQFSKLKVNNNEQFFMNKI